MEEKMQKLVSVLLLSAVGCGGIEFTTTSDPIDQDAGTQEDVIVISAEGGEDVVFDHHIGVAFDAGRDHEIVPPNDDAQVDAQDPPDAQADVVVDAPSKKDSGESICQKILNDNCCNLYGTAGTGAEGCVAFMQTATNPNQCQGYLNNVLQQYMPNAVCPTNDAGHSPACWVDTGNCF
jgi:hypothetical protein